MPGRSAGEIIREQRVIETQAGHDKAVAIAWIRKHKAYMKSLGELPYAVWRAKILKQARIDLGKIADVYFIDWLQLSYQLNKLDSLDIEDISKAGAIKAAGNIKTTGKTTKQNLSALMNVAYGTLSTGTTRLHAQGLSTDQITDAIMGTQVQRYKNGDMIRWINGARTHSSTNVKSEVEGMRQARYSKDSNVRGYVWDSVLDGRTSTTCQGLNGKRFYFYRIVDGKRIPLSGYKPLPPIHPNCRSSTQPIINGESIPEVESFTDWANDPKNDEELLEALGISRYNLFQSEQLKIERFTDARFKPLTVDDLINSLIEEDPETNEIFIMDGGKRVSVEAYKKELRKKI